MKDDNILKEKSLAFGIRIVRLAKYFIRKKPFIIKSYFHGFCGLAFEGCGILRLGINGKHS